MTRSVHVVIVNWNQAGETLGCLSSVARFLPEPAAVHVVDNGSVDDSVARIAAAFPRVVLHRNPENRGFSGGVNVGIRAALAAGADFVFLLNNDARVDPACLGELLAAAERNPAAGLYGGKIFRDRRARTLWCCGVRYAFGPNIAKLRGFDELDVGRYDREESVDSLTGCGLLVSRAVFDRIGVFDEAYFAYVEDADFAARAREAGFSCLYVASAVLEHPGGGSTGGGYSAGRKYLTAHGAARFLKRHGTAARWIAFWIFDVAAWPILFALSLARGRARAAWAKLRGTIDGLRGKPADLRILERRR